MSTPESASLQFCFSTLGCPELDLEGAMALARRFGMKSIELRALEGTVELPDLFAAKYGSPEALAAKVAEGGLTIASLDTSWKLMADGDVGREAFLKFLPWAEALGGVGLRAFDGKGDDVESSWDAARASMEWWETRRGREGWKSTLIVETHDTVFTADAITRLMTMAPDSVRLLWDSHHTWKRGEEDPIVTWNACREWVRHIHFKDSVSKPSERHPFTYVDLGAGEFPLQSLFDQLAASGYAGPVSLEWERMWHPYLAPLETALENASGRGWW